MTAEHHERPYGLLLLGGLSILVALISLIAIIAKSDDEPDTVTATTAAAKAVEGPIGIDPTAPPTSSTEAPPQLAPSLVAVALDDTTLISGRVPDDATKAAIGVQAQDLGGGAVDNQLVVDPTVSAAGGTITLSGAVLGPSGETDAIKAFLDAVPGYEVVSELDTDSMPLQLALSELFATEPIGFDSKRSEIRPGERATLDKVAELLLMYPGPSVEVEGHTDNQGIPAENRALSQQRADAVVNYLVGVGVPANRLAPEGYGDENPIATNETAEGRARNRRIVFTVLPSS
ncbi:MAG: OmpA family protein [Acidimicrobiales bacterium]|nr:OmpA family protein [Acidimicrobiales bacterium]